MPHTYRIWNLDSLRVVKVYTRVYISILGLKNMKQTVLSRRLSLLPRSALIRAGLVPSGVRIQGNDNYLLFPIPFFCVSQEAYCFSLQHPVISSVLLPWEQKIQIFKSQNIKN